MLLWHFGWLALALALTLKFESKALAQTQQEDGVKPIPCNASSTALAEHSWASRYYCYPTCLFEDARAAMTRCSSSWWYECPSPCPNVRCSLSEYYDEASASCTACPTGSVSLDFSVSASDCLNIAGNMNVAISALCVSIAVILAYVYYGRIHWVAFLRMERLVLVLIKMYSATIKALIGLRSQLRKSERSSVAAQPNATAEDRAHAESEQANHRKNVYIFWLLVVVILLTAPAVLYILQMWSTFLNTLVLWNGWKDPIAGYAQAITIAIASIADNEFFRALFEPGRRLLIALSTIKLDFGAIKLDCSGARAPLFLLVQIVVFGMAIITISSDYQVFKENVFKKAIDIFKTVIASRGYRKLIKDDERFHRIARGYVRFLIYVGLAEFAATVLDFTYILRFFLALIRYDSLKEYLLLEQEKQWYRPFFQNFFYLAFFKLYLYPFGLGVIVTMHRNTIYASLSKSSERRYYYYLSPIDRCDSAKGFLGANTNLLYITFCISLLLLVPLFYEVGKVLVPGNRLPSSFSKALLRVAPRQYFWQLPQWTLGPRQRLERLFNRGVWLFSFVAVDIWLSFLAEKWLSVVHLAIPARSLQQEQDENKGNRDGDGEHVVESDSSGESSSPENKRASMGWSAVMEGIRNSEFQSHKAPGSAKDADKEQQPTAFSCCEWGLKSQDSPFMRVFAEKMHASVGVCDESHEEVNLSNVHDVNTNDSSGGSSAVTAVAVPPKFVGERDPEGKPHGHGRYDWDGNVYLGQWTSGCIEGVGTFAYRNGVIRQGQFRDFEAGGIFQDGVGLRRNPRGDMYFGHWKNNRRHGLGIMIHKNGYYSATWDNDKEVSSSSAGGGSIGATATPTSDEVQARVDFAKEFYHGAKSDITKLFPTGRMHGLGLHACERGVGLELYYGFFVEGQRHGEGLCVFADTSFYHGCWVMGKRHGYGTLTFSDGTFYFGEWEFDRKQGPGSIVTADGDLVKGVWTRDARNLETRFALQPAADSREEAARWAQLVSERSLPTYSDLISFQYRRLQLLLAPWAFGRTASGAPLLESKVSHPGYMLFNFCIRLIVKLVSAGLVWYGAGNVLKRTRFIWWHIVQNYLLFTVSALGVWTQRGREEFSVEECIKATDAEGEASERLEADVDQNAGPKLSVRSTPLATKWALYTSAWSSIIAPRCMLFMVVPQLTPLMLWTTLMVKCPIYIADSDVPCPGWFDLATYRERARYETNAGPDQQWMVWLDAIHLFAKEGRLVQSVLNAFKFCLAVTLWRAGSQHVSGSLELWASLSLIVLLPYCFVMSLRLIIYAGKALGIKDGDVGFRVTRSVEKSQQPRPSFSLTRGSSAVGESASRSDSINSNSNISSNDSGSGSGGSSVSNVKRQSVVLDFGSTYGGGESRFTRGDVELVEQTESPLPAAAAASRLSPG